jgi:glutathione S-transferase
LRTWNNNLLGTQDYLGENRFSAADVVTGGVLFWALKLGMLKDDSPVKSYISHNYLAQPFNFPQ